MKKKDSFLKIIFAIFFSLNFLLTFFGTFIVFTFWSEYDYVIKDVVEKSLEDFKEGLTIKDDDNQKNEETALEINDDDVENAVLYKESYFYKGQENAEAIKAAREFSAHDLLTLADLKLKDDRINRQYAKYENSEDYEFETVGFILQEGELEIEVYQGFYPTGGACTETFKMQSNVGELSVCIYESSPEYNSYTVGLFMNEEDYSGLSLNYEFYFQGNYSRTEIEKIFSSITRIEK